MTQVTRVEVEGLAGRQDPVVINFNDDVNIFWGGNGCGKTSLLKIIHGALWNQSAGMQRVPFKRAVVEFIDTRDGKKITRTLNKRRASQSEIDIESITDDSLTSELVDQADPDSVEAEKLRWVSTPRVTGPRQALPHAYLPTSRVAATRLPQDQYARQMRIEGFDLQDEEAFDRMFANAIQRLWSQFTHQELIKITDRQERGIADILTAVIERDNVHVDAIEKIDSHKATSAVTKFFRGQRYRLENETLDMLLANYEDDPVLQKVVAQIIEIQREAEVIQEPTRQIRLLLQQLFTGNKIVELGQRRLAVRVDGELIPIQYLSSGEKQIMRLLIECLAAGRNSIIVDEPEISLHVDWQLRLIESMRLVNPSAQIIAATHSPEVMANLDDTKVFEL